jgi:hypothetical protein
MRRSKLSASLCWILLQMGFAEGSSHPSPGGLLPHHFTLTETLRLWRYLSVALSLALRPVDVIDHLARWSPDFPPLGTVSRGNRPRSDCPASRLEDYTIERRACRRAWSAQAPDQRVALSGSKLRGAEATKEVSKALTGVLLYSAPGRRPRRFLAEMGSMEVSTF